MTLPQGTIFYKTTLLPLLWLLLLWLLPQSATAQDRVPLFVCGTDEAADAGFLSLTGIEATFGEYTDVRFEQTANGTGEPVYQFPSADVDSRTAFLFSHSTGDEGYLVSIRWVDRGATYVYYSLDVPPDLAIENDMGGGEAALVISEIGQLKERVACIERPHMFIGYMREAMSCDMANPYGSAACEDAAYNREVTLDVETIGLVAGD